MRFPADLELSRIASPRLGALPDPPAGAAHLLARKFIDSLDVPPGFAFDLVLPEGQSLKVGTGTPAFTLPAMSEFVTFTVPP